MWDKLGWYNWFWQLLSEGLSSFNPERFCYSYAWSCSWYEERPFCAGLISRKICWFSLMFKTDFTSFSVLLLFPLLITLFVFMDGFWCYFIYQRWGSLNESICCRAYSCRFMHAIVTCTRVPFFKIFSRFVHCCPNFQIFCPFLPLFWKITCMHLLSRIGIAADMCVFGDFNVHHKAWLTYSSGTGRPDEHYCNLSFSWPYSVG